MSEHIPAEKLSPDVKAKWLEALRSGKYEQTQGCLTNGNETFCCLGVLCDVTDPKAWGAHDEWYYGTGEDKDSEVGNLPFGFRIAIGMSDEAERRLVLMNDSDCLTFPEIANWIETYL